MDADLGLGRDCHPEEAESFARERLPTKDPCTRFLMITETSTNKCHPTGHKLSSRPEWGDLLFSAEIPGFSQKEQKI